jgi:hypothetical protein
LTDWTSTFCAHSAIREDLCYRVFGCRALFPVVGGPERLDVIERVVVANKLKGVGDALDKIFLSDDRHSVTPKFAVDFMRNTKPSF